MLPMICGVALVPLCYLTARTLRAPRMTALVAMAAVASSPLLAIWSRELKQYEIEAFLAVLLALLVFRLRRQPQRRWPLVAAVIAICALGPGLGYGMVFTAVCLLSMLLVMRPVAGTRRTLLITGGVALATLALSVLIVWQLAAGQQADNEALQNFAGKWYINLTSLESLKQAAAFGSRTTVLAVVPFLEVIKDRWVVIPLGMGIWLVTLVGMIGWPRKGRRELAVWVVAPWLLVIAASVAKVYPFGMWRMMMFCVPPMVIALAVGIVKLLRWASRVLAAQRRGYGVIAGLVIALIPVLYMWRVPIQYGYWADHDYPAVLAKLNEQRRPREIALVSFDAAAGVWYYAGATEYLWYQPTTGGTLPMPGFPLEVMVKQITATGAPTWWIVTTSDRKVQAYLQRLVQTYGYQLQLKAEAGGDQAYGRAQLLLASKPGAER